MVNLRGGMYTFPNKPMSFGRSDPLYSAQKIATQAMDAQSIRLSIISQNLANANSKAMAPGQEPYARLLPVFENVYNRALGARLLRVKATQRDKAEFRAEYQPADPAADANGYVRYTNVNSLIEMMDLRQADQSFSACLKAYEAVTDLDRKVIEVLKG